MPRIVYRADTTVVAGKQGFGIPYGVDYEVALREQRLMDDESRVLGRERMELSRTFSGSASWRSENDLFELMQRIAEDEARLQADLHLALGLSREDDRVEREHQRLLAEYTSFDCSICLDTLSTDFVVSITVCGHVFCRECMKSHVIAKLEEGRYPILCPVCSIDKNQDHNGGVCDIVPYSWSPIHF